MGLKTTNYEITKLGITLPDAYARIGKVEMSDNGSGYAIMHIQATRENALTLQPIDTKRVDFFWDRRKSIAECIYEAAKVAKTVRRKNSETYQMENVVLDKMFSDWDNDIVNDEVIISNY